MKTVHVVAALIVVGVSVALGRVSRPDEAPSPSRASVSNAPMSSSFAPHASPTRKTATAPAPAATSKWDAYPPGFQDCRQDGDVLDCGSCRLDSDCSDAEACILDPLTRRWGCAPSQCATDADCGAKESCVAASDPNFGNGTVRRCVAGAQQRDDECNVLPSAFPGSNCQRGLVCVAGSCQQACTPADAAACPESVCLDTVNGAGCLVTCKTRGCRDGDECVDVDDEPICVLKGSCLADGCGVGQKCGDKGTASAGSTAA